MDFSKKKKNFFFFKVIIFILDVLVYVQCHGDHFNDIYIVHFVTWESLVFTPNPTHPHEKKIKGN